MVVVLWYEKMINGVCVEGRCFKFIVYIMVEIVEYLGFYF